MRYELSNEEWIAIKPMLPNKARGVPRVNDRRVLNGIFWVLREPVVARRHPTTLFDPVEEPLDLVASAVEIGAEADQPMRWCRGRRVVSFHRAAD